MRHFCRSIPLDGVPDVHSAHDGCAVSSRRSAPMAVGFAEERAALDLVKVDGSECRACGLDSDTLGHRLMEFSPSAGLETTVFSCPGSRSEDFHTLDWHWSPCLRRTSCMGLMHQSRMRICVDSCWDCVRRWVSFQSCFARPLTMRVGACGV